MLCTWETYAATKLWDGYVENQSAEAKRRSLVDFNSFRSVAATGIVPSTEYSVKGSRYSIHWDNHPAKPDLYIKDVPGNWSNYSAVELKIYSAKATGAEIKFLAMCPNSSEGARYYGYSFFVDWSGWKTIRIYFNDMTGAKTPSWSEITQVRLCAGGGWSIVANPETDIYIGAMDILKIDPYDFINRFYNTETVQSVYADLGNGVAAYAGGSNAVTSSGAQSMKYSFGFLDKAVTVPAEFFDDFFGASVKSDKISYTITLGENTISGKVGDNNIIVNGIETTTDIAPYLYDGRVYLPGAYVSGLLNLNYITDNKLLLVSNDDSIKEFARSENLGVNEKGEIAAYLSYHDNVNPDEVTADDCTDVKKNWVRSLVGDESTNDISDSDIKAEIDNINTTAKNSQKRLIKEENSSEIFTGITSVSTTHISSAYSHVYNMACAYSCYGGELYHNDELLSDIIYALDWLKANRYNSDIHKKSDKAAWLVTGFDNWYDWAIGTPQVLIPTLIMIEDAIGDKVTQYLEFFDSHVPLPRMTGSNFTTMALEVIGSALLKNDSSKILEVQTMITKNFLYVDDNVRFAESMLKGERATYTEAKGAGFFTDGSYILHTLHPHTGSYGASQFGAYVDFITLFAGTNFDMKIPFADNISEIFENAFDAAIFDGKIFRWTLGRVPDQDTFNKFSVYVDAFKAAPSLGAESEQKIYEIIGELADDHYQNIVESLPVYCIKHFKKIYQNKSGLPQNNGDTNKVFYNVDKVVQKNENWGFSVSMSSSRIFNYESINSQNMDGWYLSDGRTEYYLKGSNINATKTYWSSINKYRLPGTTVDTQERRLASIHQGNEYLSSKDFVGGATLGDYGAAAMHLESYHNEKDFGADGGSYGGLAPAHQSDLTAKKAYFMFDDEIVCLGSEVNAKNNNDAEVLTIVDNVLAIETVTYGDEAVNSEPYMIVSAIANQTPEPENEALNTIDDSYATKYAGELNAEITWDIGSIQTLGFIDLSFASGASRTQKFKLCVSKDGISWTEVFSGESSGKTETNEYFDLKSLDARYIKFINLGNSSGTNWVSITNCAVYPPNPDGSLTMAVSNTYGKDKVIADGKLIDLSGDDYSLDGISWVNVADNCGYVFPKESTVNQGNLKARWTKGTNSFFELWISHGINPTNGGYSYILLPGMTALETSSYVSATNIDILCNNEKIQAVTDKNLGVTGIVFWEAGSFGNITVSAPCIVVYRENNGEFHISASDPTQKLDSLEIKINKPLAPFDIDDSISVDAGSAKTVVKYNMTNSDGRSMQIKCKFEDSLN